jgi:N utilization substance protein B
MGARRSGREAALQMLFAMDAAGTSASQVRADFWRTFESDAEGRAYADALVDGVDEVRADLDERIGKASANWRLERMTRIDRNLLRLGAYEILHRRDVPVAVVIDEAVELAKAFGTEASPTFVNGVLAAVAQAAGRADADR